MVEIKLRVGHLTRELTGEGYRAIVITTKTFTELEKKKKILKFAMLAINLHGTLNNFFPIMRFRTN